jgi:hypothetical protein
MKFNFFIINFILFSTYSFCQQDTSKFSFSYGYGYFADMRQFIHQTHDIYNSLEKINPKYQGKIFHGNCLWVNSAYKLSSGFDINFLLIKAKTKTYFNDPFGFYWDCKQINDYTLLNLTFSKNIINENKHFSIYPALGLIFTFYSSPNISYLYDFKIENNDTLIKITTPTFNYFTSQETGLNFSCDFLYKIKNSKIETGIKIYTYLLFSIGFESFAISPVLKLKL